MTSGTSTSWISASSIKASTSWSMASLFTSTAGGLSLSMARSCSSGTGSSATRIEWPSTLTCILSGEVRSSMSCSMRAQQFMSSCFCMPAIGCGAFSDGLFSMRSTMASTWSTPTAERKPRSAGAPPWPRSRLALTRSSWPQMSVPFTAMTALSKAKQISRAMSMYSFRSRVLAPMLVRLLPSFRKESTYDSMGSLCLDLAFLLSASRMKCTKRFGVSLMAPLPPRSACSRVPVFRSRRTLRVLPCSSRGPTTRASIPAF
mmetsp:Transcript_69115/g.180085  ORF Transcript_69115/g.180085 Transcript_69115/m.180085 type:complete len:260 (-) Transcript_69115:320-1099(-)